MLIPPQTIPRNTYIEKIKPFIEKRLIKVLTGQRRVGKSYLLFQLIHHIQADRPEANIIYINKEDLDFASIKNAANLNEYIKAHSKTGNRNYIFIDEIQDIDGFEDALRSLLLDDDNDLYISGSNANLLSGELATKLSGRYIEFNIYSLSYPEFLQFHDLENSELSFEAYMRFGGLPYLIHLALDQTALEYLGSVYNTIVYRDVVARYNIRNSHFLETLIAFLADNIGSLFSANRISDFLKSQQTKIAPNQIQQYGAHLVSAFIVHEVKRFDIEGRKIFETGSKFYFENTGIRNHIVGYKVRDRGKLFENLVYNHMLFLGYNVRIGKLGLREIDFIGERNKELIYIQVAQTLDNQATIDREFQNLLAIPDNYPKLVISGNAFEGNTYQGIRHLQIRDFLMSTVNDLG